MSSIADLRRQAQDELEKIAKETSRLAGGGGFEKDPRYWRPHQTADGTGSALIRFLPRPDGEDFPVVRKFSYGFKGPTGRWYIENSPQTIELPCPVNERWSALWNEGTEDAKERAKTFKRRLGFISNILVIKHAARPEDEGKVFLYEYGKKIYDKIMDKMNPPDDVPAFNAFDLDSGANFRLRVLKKDGFTNYDKSEFDAPGPLSQDDAVLERVWKSCHSLKAEIAPDKFKSYAELKSKLAAVMGEGAAASFRPETSLPRVVESDAPWDAGPAVPPAAAGGDDLSWYKDLVKK